MTESLKQAVNLQTVKRYKTADTTIQKSPVSDKWEIYGLNTVRVFSTLKEIRTYLEKYGYEHTLHKA